MKNYNLGKSCITSFKIQNLKNQTQPEKKNQLRDWSKIKTKLSFFKYLQVLLRHLTESDVYFIESVSFGKLCLFIQYCLYNVV